MQPQKKRNAPGKKQPGRNSGNRRGKSPHRAASPAKNSTSKKIYYIAGGVIGLLLLCYIGISVYFMNHFFINTEINGHSFSGKTAADAEKYLKEQVKQYTLTVHEKDNKTDTIKASDISLVYQENDHLENILKKQNAFLWPQSLFSKKSANITIPKGHTVTHALTGGSAAEAAEQGIDLSYDKEALEREINSLEAVKTEQTPPVSAKPKFDGNQFVVEPEIYGTAVDMDILKEKVIESIMKFSPSLDLEKEKCYASPKYTSDSEEVKKACSEMNQYCKASITYPMNENVVVDKALISTWLSVDENMKVTFKDDALKKWLADFGDKYDTVGITRTFTTPTGKSASVSGGTYGWSINEDTEFENLKASIQNGETVTREPAYYIGGTAAAHAMPDWGSTFAEVDLTEQKMWYVVNGEVALMTDVITGEPIPEKITPEGTFSLLDKKMNEVLVGSIDPSTGKPSYETEVTYWMRITWDTGIGFHDATWQSGFGGTLYQIPNVGSHGCINMPYGQAEALYNMIEIGTPVIIHY